MVKRTKQRRRRTRSGRAASGESKRADLLTSGWMLTVVTALACELGFAAAQWYSTVQRGTAVEPLGRLLLFAALLIGLAALLLTPVVLKSRRVPPPRGITLAAVAVGLAPLGIILWKVLD